MTTSEFDTCLNLAKLILEGAAERGYWCVISVQRGRHRRTLRVAVVFDEGPITEVIVTTREKFGVALRRLQEAYTRVEDKS